VKTGNIYIPKPAVIEKVEVEEPETWTFTLSTPLEHTPGQFVEISIPGYGEAPISIASPSGEKLMLTVRRTGTLTGALHRKKVGEMVGIRGPFGRGWPHQEAQGETLLLVAGGIGLAPVRPIIEDAYRGRLNYERLLLLYGAREPALLLYKKDLDRWAKKLEVFVTVDRKNGCETAPKVWDGRTGVVTELFKEVDFSPGRTWALVCGPPIMMHFATKGLISKGVPLNRIHLSLERHMKCGMGICGHCQIGGKYVCKDGPVFSVHEALSWREIPDELEGVA